MRVALLYLALLAGKQLTGAWTHSREEDRPGVRVYRPNSYNFPPARGRDGFTFGRNGTYTEEAIGKADGRDITKGTWKQTGPNTFQTYVGGKPARLLKVLTLTKDKLEIYEAATDPKAPH